jgi:predicted DNA-binding protein
MSSVRTQIYLTGDQRKKLDARAKREGRSLATLIREAVDDYVQGEPAPLDVALDSTFGRLPDLEVPARSEWHGRGG